jgi:putative heme-binding domain-containing protein
LALVARRLLEQQPDDKWCREVIDSKDIAVFMNGSLATLNAHPSLTYSYDILAQCSQLMQGYLKDSEFVGLLRLVQLALVRGQVDPAKIPAFVEQFSQEFPTTSSQLNRELIRILAYLSVGDLDGRFIEYLDESSDDASTKVLVAMHLASKAAQLDDATRLKLIAFLHQSQKIDGGGSYRQYLVRCIRETAGALTPTGALEVIKNGNEWSDALIPVFYNLPEKPSAELVAMLIQLDSELALNSGDAARHARLGIIALLAQSQSEKAMEHLRSLWREEEMRRADLAIGLAQSPAGKNWNYLVASLPVLDDVASVEVMQKLMDVALRPVEARYYRQLIEIGFRMQGEGAIVTSKLLEHWAAESVSDKHDQWEETMEAWKTWFETKWPTETPVNTNTTPVETGHSMERILEKLNSKDYQSSAERGLAVYKSASCAKCHRLGTNGQATGPELTGLANRFSKREALDAILNPSKIIPDRYQSKLVLTTDGNQIIGLQVSDNGDSISLQLIDGQVVRVAKSEIEETKTVIQSAMPANLLDTLSLEQIADLFAFMYPDSTATRVGSQTSVAETK